MTRLGAIAAFAATIGSVAPATADEASVSSALSRHAQASFVGLSSYYGAQFHGRRTADGEVFNMHGLSAAHKTLPLPCYARVTNLGNHRSVVVRINDRGPYVSGRMLDVSARVAQLLAFNGGLQRVRLDYLGMAGPAGDEDQQALLASLKTGAEPVAVAAAKPPEDGVTVAERSAPALAYTDAKPRAPAAAALEAAVRPPIAAPEPLGVAAKLDASVRQLETALETAHQTAARAVTSLSPYGALVIAPFKPLIEAAR